MSKYKTTVKWLMLIVCLGFLCTSYAQVQVIPYTIVFGVQNISHDAIYGEYELSSMNIYQITPDVSEPQLLVQEAGNEYFSLSPDGKFIVYVDIHSQMCVSTCLYDLHIKETTDISGNIHPSRCKLCLPTGDFRSPTSVVWSPDSAEFAFATWYPEPAGIYIYDTTLHTFSLFRKYITGQGIPSWSPDATHLSIMWGGTLEIYESESGTRTVYRSIRFAGDTGANWSPSGSRIAVTGLGVHIIDSELEEITNLTPEQATVINDESITFRTTPQWLLDESRLIVEGATYGLGRSLYIYSIDTNTMEKHILAEGTQPQLSPDGEWIVFLGRGELENDIYIMRSDGTDLQQITQTSDTELFPQWAASS